MCPLIVLGAGVEAGTGFGREVAVAVDGETRIAGTEIGYECGERPTPAGRAGVGRSAVSLLAAYIYYTYRTGVMPQTMRSRLRLRTPGMDSTVKVNYVMITDAIVAPGAMPGVDIGVAAVATARSGGAMDNDGINLSHNDFTEIKMVNYFCKVTTRKRRKGAIMSFTKNYSLTP